MAKNTGQTSDRTDPLHNARAAIKMGDTQTAVTRLASKRHDRMTDDEKELLVVAVRAVYLEKQLARHIRSRNRHLFL